MSAVQKKSWIKEKVSQIVEGLRQTQDVEKKELQ